MPNNIIQPTFTYITYCIELKNKYKLDDIDLFILYWLNKSDNVFFSDGYIAKKLELNIDTVQRKVRNQSKKTVEDKLYEMKYDRKTNNHTWTLGKLGKQYLDEDKKLRGEMFVKENKQEIRKEIKENKELADNYNMSQSVCKDDWERRVVFINDKDNYALNLFRAYQQWIGLKPKAQKEWEAKQSKEISGKYTTEQIEQEIIKWCEDKFCTKDNNLRKDYSDEDMYFSKFYDLLCPKSSYKQKKDRVVPHVFGEFATN